jgi:hypothetical protein
MFQQNTWHVVICKEKRFFKLQLMEVQEYGANVCLILLKSLLNSSEHGRWHHDGSTYKRESDHMVRQETRGWGGIFFL